MTNPIPYDILGKDERTNLSTHLYNVLDRVGVRENVRNIHTKSAMILEILSTALDMHTNFTSLYIFGSSSEGTTTRDMKSDRDILVCTELFKVVENMDEEPRDRFVLRIVSDEETKPGYVKLEPILSSFREGKECVNLIGDELRGKIEQLLTESWPKFIRHFDLPVNREKNGPAITKLGDEFTTDVDQVNAYRCQCIPSFADEWLHRVRPYNWPTTELLKKMRGYGCFLVGVGHPRSPNKEEEWRLSFSLQERELMSSLNPTQYKCYVLLKMIKKDIIQRQVGKSLSSYHCKTCMFHLVENTRGESWKQENLIHFLTICLRLLLQWVREENCPNYFIQEENMFDRIDKTVLSKLSVVLRNILASEMRFLFSLGCDSVGNLLSRSYKGLSDEIDTISCRPYFIHEYGLCHANVKMLHKIKIDLYRYCNEGDFLSRATELLRLFEQTDEVTEHEPRYVRMAIPYILPFLRLAITQSRASKALNGLNGRNKGLYLAFSFKDDIKNCADVDLISSGLISASVDLYTGCTLDKIEKSLNDLELSLKPRVISLCACQNVFDLVSLHLQETYVTGDLSFEDYQKNWTAACMIFPPSQASLVHPVLQYEMYRSVYTSPHSRDPYEDIWFDWIVVDSKTYLYFLQYLLYTKKSDTDSRKCAIDKLRDLIDTKGDVLGHKETAYNLLGWICMQENNLQSALMCFLCSLKIRPIHNAAKWHVIMVIHSLLGEYTRKSDAQVIYSRKWFA